MDNATKCIYCFQKFLPIDAHFRAKAPISNVDSEQQQEELVDIKLKEHYKTKLNFDDKTAESKAMQYPYFTRNDKNISFDIQKDEITQREYIKEIKLNSEFYNSEILSTDLRLCPHCHNKLPKGFGIKDLLVISLIGDTFSGKSVYLAVLLHDLINRGDFYKGSLAEMGDKNELNLIKSYQEKIFQHRELPEASPTTNVMPPLFYNYTYNYIDNEKKVYKRSVDIAFFDIAGENCREDEKLRELGYNVKNSDGIIFLINPLAIDYISSHFKAHGIVTGDTSTRSQQTIINAIYKDFLSENSKKSTIPTALAISKADIFNREDVQLSFFKTYPESKILSKNYEKALKKLGCISKEDLSNLNDDVKTLLEHMDSASFVNSMDNYFEKYSLFALSALNQSPVETVVKINDKENKIVFKIPNDIIPFRVTDPFYWILAQNNMLCIYSKDDFDKPKPIKKQGIFSKIFGIKN